MMVDMTRELITPERAAELLGANTFNRNIRRRHVGTLARTITEGDWVLNGDAIRIAKDGTLLDGQHRLLAVIEADSPIETFVVTGLPNTVMATVDVGYKRSLADALRLRGVENATIAAAVTVLHWRQRNDQLMTNNSPTVAEGLREFEMISGVENLIPHHFHMYRRLWRGAPSAYCLMLYEFQERDADALEEFAERLETATHIDPGSAIHALHRWMSSGSNHRPVSLMAVMIKAWNAYVLGEPVEVLIWRPVGRAAEKFPVIQ